jgi:hypothetical protein
MTSQIVISRRRAILGTLWFGQPCVATAYADVVLHLIIGSLVTIVVGCGGAKSATQPTPVPSAPVQFSLFGWVRDTALRPLAGARVEVIDGPLAGESASTDGAGRFDLPGTFSYAATVRAAKEGYVPSTKSYQARTPGRQAIDLVLELTTPSVNIAGEYVVTLMADASCSGELPDAARTRTYTVVIGSLSNSPGQYQAVLSGATFFPVRGDDQFLISVAGTDASFFFGAPYDDGSSIVEQLAPSTYLAIWGGASLSVGGPTIAGPLNGGFEYCPSPAPFTAVGGLYRCPVQTVGCWSANHRVQMLRR